jgi:hypothetical protein
MQENVKKWQKMGIRPEFSPSGLPKHPIDIYRLGNLAEAAGRKPWRSPGLALRDLVQFPCGDLPAKTGVWLLPFPLEREVLLGHITEENDDDRGQYLRQRGINMKLLYKELDKDIVQEQTDHDQQKIAEQLYPPMQGRLREHDIPHQEEPDRETDTPGHDNGGDMRFEHKNPKAQILLMEDEIITDGITDDIDQRIRPPAGRISESLQRHDPPKGRIKEINESDDPFLCHLFTLVKTTKIRINRQFETRKPN